MEMRLAVLQKNEKEVLKMSEKVLVFPSSLLDNLGSFQGFYEQGKYYLNGIKSSGQLQFMERSVAETCEYYRQLIPYCVFTYGSKYFVYQRTKKSGEARLRGNMALGIGGHLNPCDGEANSDLYDIGLDRELKEEIHPDTKYFGCGVVGAICDNTDAVGRVHFGIVHLYVAKQPEIQLNEEALLPIGFMTVKEMCEKREQFEGWSKILIDFLRENA
jgi:predicted NUDIX family phosphoesterase